MRGWEIEALSNDFKHYYYRAIFVGEPKLLELLLTLRYLLENNS
jgi:hypothetical protein